VPTIANAFMHDRPSPAPWMAPDAPHFRLLAAERADMQ